MDIWTVILFIIGLGLLIGGAEWLVRGASRLAAAAGISPLVIGLTIVAFGTSAPELAVSIQASLNGQADISIGNVIGSNIFNILFILGLAALIAPLIVSQQLVRLDVPIMIGVSFLLLIFSFDGKISQLDGLILFAGALGYTTFAIYLGRKEGQPEVTAEYTQEYGPDKLGRGSHWLVNLGFIGLGLAALVIGSNWLVDGAVALARLFGVNELIIGLTIVAAGTSLPEVATSIVASVRGERDIAVGNVVGSNIFNILTILGLTGLITPGGINVNSAALNFDMPVMVGVAVACLPIFFTDHLIARWEGGLFFGYYVAYTLYLIFGVTQSQALPTFRLIMLLFVIPLTVITLVILTIRALRTNRRAAT